ncbi:MAG: 2-oxoglutarate dehydrogenase complex dihydrolipoyllysine-residue succinyltransferase [Phycisphaerales bacterium]
MPVDIKIPEMGESVRTGVIARWIKAEGEVVNRDEPVLELETDKITAEIPAPATGRVKHAAKAGDTVAVGAVVGLIEEGAGAAPAAAKPAPGAAPGAGAPVAAAAKGTSPARAAAAAAGGPNGRQASGVGGDAAATSATPLARKLAEEHGISLAALHGTGAGGKVREQDVLAAVAARTAGGSGGSGGAATATAAAPAAARPASASPSTLAPQGSPSPANLAPGAVRREKLSPLRQRIAARLVEAQHAAAMLTTFNEVDMTAVMGLRSKHKEEFEKKHGVGLGFMSFFVKAATSALRTFPMVNASLVQGAAGDLEVEHREGNHIAVAVSTPKGLTVPVLRNTQSLSFAQIEAGIKDLATRAREGKLTLDDLQGGTFTITNGGIFGSLLSTPILNAPQSAILGMHTIKSRPVEHPDKPGEIALRPMMYLALSYDHRLLDGSEAVQFLVHIKNALEKPERLLIGL